MQQNVPNSIGRRLPNGVTVVFLYCFSLAGRPLHRRVLAGIRVSEAVAENQTKIEHYCDACYTR